MSELLSILAGILILLGSAFSLIAALGILRMPDLFMRMHAATKAGTLGVGFIVLAVAIFFADLRVFVEALLIIVFLLLTAPIGTHVLARAAYIKGLVLWETDLDELKDHYETESSSLAKELNPKPQKRLI